MLKKYLHLEKQKNVKLFTADMKNIPLPDNSIDIVFFCHALEPNHGNEKQIIKELFRITRRYVILIETYMGVRINQN